MSDSGQKHLSIDKDQIQIGRIYREHGIKGYCKLSLFQEFADLPLQEERFLTLISQQNEVKKAKIQDIKVQGRYLLVKFNLFSTPESLLLWRKAGVWMKKTQIPRAPGEIFDHEWEGFKIYQADGCEIGRIKTVLHNPLKQFLVARPNGVELMVPCVPDWILSVKIKSKRLIMQIPEGLLEL